MFLCWSLSIFLAALQLHDIEMEPSAPGDLHHEIVGCCMA